MHDTATAHPVVPVLQHAGHSDHCGTFMPEDDAPPVLVIGSRAAAEKIEGLAKRHGLSAGMLLAFARAGLSGAG
nr:hypothetical protein [Variovorax boronicumulans]